MKCPHGCSSSSPQQWAQFSQYNVARAREAVLVSQQMRENMSLSRAQVGEMHTLQSAEAGAENILMFSNLLLTHSRGRSRQSGEH